MLILNSDLTGHLYFSWHPYPDIEDDSRRGVSVTALCSGGIMGLKYSLSRQLP